MRRLARLLVIPIVLLFGLPFVGAGTGPNGAWAGEFRPIRDDANFFSAAAKEQANAKMKRLNERTGHELIIETFPNAPPGVDKNGIDMAAHLEAHEHFKDLKVNGVYIGIWKLEKGSHFYVEVGNNTGEKLFPDFDKKSLLAILGKKEKPDEKLLEAVNFVDSEIESHIKKGAGTGARRKPFERHRRVDLPWHCRPADRLDSVRRHSRG